MKKLITFLAIIAFFVPGLCHQCLGQANTNFVGVWTGVAKGGVTYEITLNSNWTCTCKINGVVNPDIVRYRIYTQGSSSSLSPDQKAAIKTGDKIKFFTQNAMNGILCPVSLQGTGALSSAWDQTYNGSVSLDATFSKMTLFIDLNTTPCSIEAHSFSGSPLLLTK
jgi:hypothetical protein